MEILKKTFTVDVYYNHFEPGTIVTPTCDNFELPHGTYWEVTRSEPPTSADDLGLVWLKNHAWGVDSRYLTEIEPSEANIAQATRKQAA